MYIYFTIIGDILRRATTACQPILNHQIFPKRILDGLN